MLLTSADKKKIFKEHNGSEANCGGAEGQIAIFTERINHLTEHLKIQPKDKSTQRALIKMVGKRRSLLDHLHNTEIDRYRQIIQKLNIRK
ncbi:MAG TPA: 30S ribosomal protein S15 [Bacteroidia bacterium]|nr:30S ribosomal protein S15 [Bacteroidia bacterium]HNT80370.1 30S ribosomal protein S15 [Bacteroidia bacterium]